MNSQVPHVSVSRGPVSMDTRTVRWQRGGQEAALPPLSWSSRIRGAVPPLGGGAGPLDTPFVLRRPGMRTQPTLGLPSSFPASLSPLLLPRAQLEVQPWVVCDLSSTSATGYWVLGLAVRPRTVLGVSVRPRTLVLGVESMDCHPNRVWV